MVATPSGEIAIENIRKGDKVLTPFGVKSVQWSGLRKKKADLWQLDLSNGRSIVCTPEHKIYKNGLWISADSLQYGDSLFSIGEVSWADQQRIQSSILTDLATTENQVAILRLITEKAGNICTAQSGRIIMAKFRKDLLFTIKMVIRRITKKETWKLCAQKHMVATTPKSTIGIFQRKWEGVLLPQGRPQRSGMARQKAGHGIVSILKRFGQIERLNRLYVCIAEINIQLLNSIKRRGFAPQLANQMPEEKVELMMRRENAQYVTRNSLLINTQKQEHVVSVVASKPLKQKADVYDLTIQDALCFYVSGVLVHNCVQYVAVYIRAGYADKNDDWQEDYDSLDDGANSITGY